MLERVVDNPNIEKLKKFRMPVITSVNQLVDVLELTPDDEKRFFGLFAMGASFYHSYRIKKKTGGYRTIDELVDDKVRDIQIAIDTIILRRAYVSPCCHSYIKGKSIVTNAKAHLGASTLMKFDISDFFGSINYSDVVSLFMNLGYGINVSKFLGFFCVNKKWVVPQGAITSPMISNLVCSFLDRKISSYCEKSKLIYTRYADDITISSKEIIDNFRWKIIKKGINRIIMEEGFMPNSEKCHIFRPGKRFLVTGVMINNNCLNPKKEVVEELKLAIHYIEKKGLENHYNAILKNPKMAKYDSFYCIDSYLEHLYGLICYVKMINVTKGEQLYYELSRALEINVKSNNQ